MECSIDGCEKPAIAKGFCSKHYQRFRSHGDPNKLLVLRNGTKEQKFWPFVLKTDGCWLWTAPLVGGYGRAFLKGKAIKAHRLSYLIHNGEIPKGLLILHNCDNTACVRPDHLYAGTVQNNTDDRESRGRSNIPSRSGENHWMNKKPEKVAHGERFNRSDLTSKKVIEIVTEFLAGGITQAALAEKHGIGRKNLNLIIKGKIWKRATEGLL